MSEHVKASPEITYVPEHGSGTGKIWRVFWILLVITLIELGLGLLIYSLNLPDDTKKRAIKYLIIILSLAKAYYIVSVFMHLGDEIKNFKLTIVIPLCLFIWFITAFLWDGNSWKNLRNTNAGSRVPATEQVAPAAKNPGAKD